ncbi:MULTISPECIES: cytochrome c oxidase subunit I [Novosphingobium]|jgi:cytochrome c oxidase subunit 1|uniref:Cytochrome c oxidase subunit 1 n=1 Tax=Novosphingobium panipatense TaxID=428991 RepID=A0ABY1QMS2_9SPHN|nr:MULTISPECIES: cytochrome c oxidase subunit I [Novosphingobium]SMP75516.1 cytochrome c oxidase subunit 1 [Novosphingobium panipatense]
MSEAEASALGREPGQTSFLSEGGTTLRSWLLTTDHKRIAFLYAAGITFFFFLGGVAAVLMRAELVTPPGDLLTADEYNRAFTLHGVVMVWFFLVPSIPTTLGNFLLPLMIGAREVAFPRLNLASWYIYVGGGLLTLLSLLAGGVDTGWTFYTPFSTLYSNSYVLLAAAGVFVVGFSSIATGINFLATIHLLRAKGMTWMRLPLFVWAMYTVSVVMVLATPVLAMSLLLVFVERAFDLPVFDPRAGGDPLLFQHLFWFYSHPAVYIMVLPAFGVVSEIIACEARRRVFGYDFMVYAMVAIAVVGFMVWGHHMFVSGQSPFANLVFSFLSFVVAVPSAIKVFNWTGTLYRGQIRFSAPMLYALGFVGLFTLGGLTGLMLASVPIDVHVTDTYFVVAHFHYIMVGGSVSAFFGGLHFWWPKITGRVYSETLAKFAAVAMFFGFNFTFFPQFVMGYNGMPRRYHEYPPEFQVWHVMSSTGAVVLAFAYVWPLCYLTWSLIKGPRAGDNPHDATGLEWQTSSPPPKNNFASPPIVEVEPYRYHPEGFAPHEVEQTHAPQVPQ